jgi:hypothetical protein
MHYKRSFSIKKLAGQLTFYTPNCNVSSLLFIALHFTETKRMKSFRVGHAFLNGYIRSIWLRRYGWFFFNFKEKI